MSTSVQLSLPDGPSSEWDGGVANGGDERWYVDGKLHRLDGPAIQRDGGAANGGDEGWYVNGTLHRLDGPALQSGGGTPAVARKAGTPMGSCTVSTDRRGRAVVVSPTAATRNGG